MNKKFIITVRLWQNILLFVSSQLISERTIKKKQNKKNKTEH